MSNGVGDAPFRIQAAGVSQEYRECSSLHPGCRAEAIPHSLRVSLEILQHSHGELGRVFSSLVDNKGNANPPVKRPGDLPETNDNPHPYTDFEDLEIDNYIATDEKTHKQFMDIENQISEVIFVCGSNV